MNIHRLISHIGIYNLYRRLYAWFQTSMYMSCSDRSTTNAIFTYRSKSTSCALIAPRLSHTSNFRRSSTSCLIDAIQANHNCRDKSNRKGICLLTDTLAIHDSPQILKFDKTWDGLSLRSRRTLP